MKKLSVCEQENTNLCTLKLNNVTEIFCTSQNNVVNISINTYACWQNVKEDLKSVLAHM